MKIKATLRKVEDIQNNRYFKKYERYGFLAIGFLAGYLMFGATSSQITEEVPPLLANQESRDFKNSITWFLTGVNNSRAIGEICYDNIIADMDGDQLVMAYYEKIKSINFNESTMGEAIFTENSMMNYVTKSLFECESEEDDENEAE